MKYKNIREEELKNKIGVDWFKDFDTTEIIGNVDFSVFPKQDSIFGRTPLLWAEAKTGNFDITTMFVQLILTIGKARTFDKMLPPAFLGVFDFKKIAFISYINVQDIFYLNDFNWNVTPSNHDSKEFKLIKERIENNLKHNSYIYDYLSDETELRTFIKKNIAKSTEASKIKIDKNNFIPIYLRWLEIVKPSIEVNWDDLKKANILDSDFYLADLFVDDKDTQKIDDDSTVRDNLFVIFQNQGYKIAKENIKQMFDATINLKNKEMYQHFWKRYKRPPIKAFQNYIIERRDLLVPQDIRERKGAFFTPRQWVELSQKYLSDALGTNWQDEYYIWDCAAGTGNLLTGLTNKYNIWASTLDQADVNVMHDRIHQGANLLDSHVFQFDFLNDDFDKIPAGLIEIVTNPIKREKLLIYINPPYAEASSYGIKSKEGVSSKNKTYEKYKELNGSAINELYIQFFTRIYREIPNCKLASFSKLKHLNSQNFGKFRGWFKANYLGGFICKADTFDNVKGQFPIGFLIWDLSIASDIMQTETDIAKNENTIDSTKTFYAINRGNFIIDWLRNYFDKTSEKIGYLRIQGVDVQQNRTIFITSKPSDSDFRESKVTEITKNNLIETSIYFTLRNIIEPNWLNDRDQYLYPNDRWQSDKVFQNDCLAYALFTNNIQSKDGPNHWIPFTEYEVNSKDTFESHFITNYLKGKISKNETTDLFNSGTRQEIPLYFSATASAVFNAGKNLWSYYHSKEGVKINASLHDIREYFQGRNQVGKMNNKSDDETYNHLISNLRINLKSLAKNIEPNIYEYEFLKE